MIDERFETTPEEVLSFLISAGIKIEKDPSIQSFQIESHDGSIIEMPRNWNIFDEFSNFSITKNCSYEFFATEDNSNSYVLVDSKQEFDNYIEPSQYILAA